MAGQESIWFRLGAHGLVDWTPRFARAEQGIHANINSSPYFTLRMNAAVTLLAAIQSELRTEVRRASEQCTTAEELDDPESIAAAVLERVLNRCIETIQAQVANGRMRGILNAAMLEGPAQQSIRTARERHSVLSELMVAELEQRRRQLDVPDGGSSRRPQSHSVLLIHGIRTRAEWAERTASILRASDPTIHAIPLRYGFFGGTSFLLPFQWLRERQVSRITKLLRDEITRKPAHVSVIAHSFGTYIVSKILERESDISFHRLVLCGSIIPEDFPWEKFSHRLDPDAEGHWHAVNDCGMRDVWPVFAASATRGDGPSGRFGFGHPRVKDRFFDVGHSDFFSEEHVKTNWLPYLSDGIVVDGVLTRSTNAWWLSFLTKLRYPIVVAPWLCILAGIAGGSWLMFGAPAEGDGQLERPGLYLGMSWREFSETMSDANLSVKGTPGEINASYDGVFWSLPAQIKHEFVDGRLATSLLTIKVEECDAVMYDSSRKPIGTASQQCGISATTTDAMRVCKAIDDRYQALVMTAGGPIDRLESRYIARQWLSGEIIKQHGGNGWAGTSTAADQKEGARMERFKVTESTYVQFQFIEWNWDYWTLNPARQTQPNVEFIEPRPYPMSDNYKRFGCFLQYRVSMKSNFAWDFHERQY